jgi:transcriptional regulator with XRE-family HTH domain
MSKRAAKIYGDNLRMLREKFNMKQREIAALLEVAPQAVSEWERGVYLPSRGNQARLAELFCTTRDYMLGIVRDQTLNESEQSLVAKYRNLALDSDRQSIQRILTCMIMGG